jgi:hypothetical protein
LAFLCFCGLAGLSLCILPVYLGRFMLFLMKSSYLSKKKKNLNNKSANNKIISVKSPNIKS